LTMPHEPISSPLARSSRSRRKAAPVTRAFPPPPD
jgi:hypothetical protein